LFMMIMQLGMGSALETLCGQAYGAKKLHMLGVYMQRSWIILTIMCICLLPIYLCATPILLFFHQNEEIASMAGKFSLYMIPQLFVYGINFPIQKFLQAQSKVMTMAVVSAAALVFHLFLSWLLIARFRLGLIGAAIALNSSWWFVVLGQFAYIDIGYCPGAWNGFSRLAFKDLGAFTKLSIGSAIMMWLVIYFFPSISLLEIYSFSAHALRNLLKCLWITFFFFCAYLLRLNIF
jgi:multidrug resistance protein, MATE family